MSLICSRQLPNSLARTKLSLDSTVRQYRLYSKFYEEVDEGILKTALIIEGVPSLIEGNQRLVLKVF